MLDGLDIDEIDDGIHKFVHRVDWLDEVVPQGIIKVGRQDITACQPGDLLLDFLGDRLVGIPPAFDKDLDAVVVRGVMRGCDTGRVDGSRLLCLEHHYRCRDVFIDKTDRNTVAGQDFGKPCRGLV